MNESRAISQQFQLATTYSTIFLDSIGVTPTQYTWKLGTPTYASDSGLVYKTGALLAYDTVDSDGNPTSSSVLINCDPTAMGAQANPVAILYDDYLPIGTAAIGQYPTVVIGAFDVLASGLFATAADLSDVPDAMANWSGASYNNTTRSYTKF